MSPAPVLPLLTAADFDPGKDHVVETWQGGKVVLIAHKSDPARLILPNLHLVTTDPYTYVFLHGGEDFTRFENMRVGTHEIPEAVVAQLLVSVYGIQLDTLQIRLCTCYGNLLRPGDVKTLAQRLAGLLPRTRFEAYHGLVRLFANPAEIRLGSSVQWDAVLGGAVIVGPPGNWEPVTP